MAPPHRNKLIEVALPLDAINAASAREKSIRHGHPSTLHLWWARRPLAAARAVLFAQMVDDPSAWPDLFPTEEAQQQERDRLFRIIEQLVQWENTTNEEVVQQAREEIRASWRRTCAAVLQEKEDRKEEIEERNEERGERNEEREERERERLLALFDPDRLPAFHDPFAGGGAIPLEAQRLGLEAYASDLNPVAVTINKAMIEIPPKFAGRPPVNPATHAHATLFAREWEGAQGLADDVRFYGQWMRDEAQQRIGHLYPQIEVTPEMAAERPDLTPLIGERLTVIAWLWARTVKSPNPAFAHVDVPLVTTFILSSKPGNEAYVEPVIENRGEEIENRGEEIENRGEERGKSALLEQTPASSLLSPISSFLSPIYRFTVKTGKPPEWAKHGTKLARGANFRCLLSGMPIKDEYIKAESMAGRMGARMLAIVADGPRGRVYLPPTAEHEAIARSAQPSWKPDQPMSRDTRDLVSGRGYGFFTWADLFTPRQLVALTTFADLVGEAIERVKQDARAAGMPDDGAGLADGGMGATAYAQAVGVYLALALDKVADRGSTLGRWDPTPTQSGIINAFSRQALPMTWDFAESNPLGDASGNYVSAVDLVAKALLVNSADVKGLAQHADAQTQTISANKLISTDPPYYDNIGYADLSDFFYVWLRRTLRPIFPDLYATLSTPKAEELVATPYRHGSKQAAERFFMEGMTRALHNLAMQAHPAFPVTIFYAFKQQEVREEKREEREEKRGERSEKRGEREPLDPNAHSSLLSTHSSTGWETFLDAVIQAGFAITGTWPMRTELGNRILGQGANALASSIVLVCRPRPADAPIATRRAFVAALNAELPAALAALQRANIAPVDLAQAAIGPGMAVYTRYARVVDAQGNPVRVREALTLINQTLDEVLSEQEGDFDADTRWALAWFEQHGFAEGDFGVAETLSKAKNTSIEGLAGAGILDAKRGRVRLLKPAELAADWDPARDTRFTHWEAVHHLIRVLETGGEMQAAELAAKLGSRADVARELAYRLYVICERKKRPEEAFSYNALVQSWGEIVRLAQSMRRPTPAQHALDL